MNEREVFEIINENSQELLECIETLIDELYEIEVNTTEVELNEMFEGE